MGPHGPERAARKIGIPWSPPMMIGSAPAARESANRRLGAAVMRLEVGWVGAYVAAIYPTNRLAVIEWAAEVEVVALERTHDPIARLPHRLRHVGLVIDRDPPGKCRHPRKECLGRRCSGFEMIQIGNRLGVEEGLLSGFAWRGGGRENPCEQSFWRKRERRCTVWRGFGQVDG